MGKVYFEVLSGKHQGEVLEFLSSAYNGAESSGVVLATGEGNSEVFEHEIVKRMEKYFYIKQGDSVSHHTGTLRQEIISAAMMIERMGVLSNEGEHRIHYIKSQASELTEVIAHMDKLNKTEEDFLEAVKNTRAKFVKEVKAQKWNTEMRTSAEDLLIIFDQMHERLK